MPSLHPDTVWLYPEWFAAIPVLMMVYLYKWRTAEKKLKGMAYPDVAKFTHFPKTIWTKSLWFRRLPDLVRMLALCLVVVALARPRWGQARQSTESQGVDIVLALDVSGSMDALDLLTPSQVKKFQKINPNDFYKSGRASVHNRLGVAKRVIDNFIDNRPGDRMGLVVFAGEAITQSPLTTDGEVLRKLLKDVSKNSVSVPLTAIGDALMVSINRLKESPSQEKLIILLTDGANNEGSVQPLKAASVAKAIGVRVYTIGVGKRSGSFLHPQQSFFGGMVWGMAEVNESNQVDEPVLQKIAEETGGRYYRATRKDELKKIYEEIDQLEKTEFKENQWIQFHEQFLPWLLLSMLILIVEHIMRWTYWRSTL